ncbi:MAG: hypothetical protein IKR44_04405 [Bacteroidales bacterium]|nr:hypothetical protein [Bacteroidales bacterium]
MNEINIDEFLRNNKPVVKDDPAFLLKVRQRLDAVEGIKDEVDRQRRLRHIALRVTLLIGIVIGCLITAFIILAPLDSIRSFVGEWNLYIAIAASVSITLISVFLGGNSLLSINKLRLLLPLKKA